MHVDPLQRNMNNAAKTEAAREKAAEPRKPQNPEALRAQEQKVTHDKVVGQYLCITISKVLPLFLFEIHSSQLVA